LKRRTIRVGSCWTIIPTRRSLGDFLRCNAQYEQSLAHYAVLEGALPNDHDIVNSRAGALA